MLAAWVLALSAAPGDPGSASRPRSTQDLPFSSDEAERVTPVVRVVQVASPAVVHVRTSRTLERAVFDWSWRPRERTREEVDHLEGSGAVIDPAGYIVTNEHVVRGAEKIRVRFDQGVDGRELAAETIAVDRENDLALLKVERDEPCPTVRLGRSDDLLIGETVVAIGNALGEGLNAHSSTVSVGILSALGRDLNLPKEGRSYRGLLQTDAPINPGNSGGALLNVRGELIGINTAILPDAQGIGFAIPVDRVRDILHTNLFNVDRSARFWLGMRLEERDGVAVSSVEPGGPAGEAGIRAGDRILAVEETEVGSILELAKRILPKSAGDPVAFRIRRGEEVTRVSVVLGSSANRYLRERLGCSIEPAASGSRRVVRIAAVVPRSRADRVGFKTGDLLLGVGLPARPATLVSVQGPDALAALLREVPSRGTVRVLVQRSGETYQGEVVLR